MTSKANLLRLGKYIGIYLVGLSVGTFLGLLPVLALIAGLPIILAERRLGKRAAQIVGLVSLAVTWFLLDELLFVYIGLGVMVGYGLAMIPAHVPFRLRLAQSLVTGFVWSLVMNFTLQMMRGEGLLALLGRTLQQALVTTVERMQALELYNAAQVSEFQQYGQLMLETLQSQWAYLLFIYLLLSTVGTIFLARAFSQPKAPTEDLLANKAPIGLAAVTAVLAALHYLLPTMDSLVVQNLWNISALVLSLYGFGLLFFYLRFTRVGPFWRVLLGFYLITSPIVWRVMLLVGGFDAIFDYRFYARNKNNRSGDKESD